MLRLLPGISSLLIFTLVVQSPAFFVSETSPEFFLLAEANAGSSVGPQNRIGHPAHRYRRLMQVPVLCAHGIEMGSKTRAIVFLGLRSEIVDVIRVVV